MEKATYRVLLTGETLPGFRRQDVIADLARLFRVSAGDVMRRLNAGEVPVEHQLVADGVLDLQMKLENIGARTRVERSAAGTAAAGGAKRGLRLPDDETRAEQQLIDCETCGHRQLSGWKCEQCGMVFDRRVQHSPFESPTDPLSNTERPFPGSAQPASRRNPPSAPGQRRPRREDIHARTSNGLRDDWLDEHDPVPTEQYHVRLFMGVNSAHLSQPCEKMMLGRRTGLRLSWAGGALFSPFLWAMHRKMWAWGTVILFVEILLPMFFLTLGVQDGVSPKVAWVGLFLMVINRLFWPLILKWMYCRHARNTIALMNRMAPTFAPDIDIAARGGTSRTSVFVGFVIAMVLAMLTWSIVDSVFRGLSETTASGYSFLDQNDSPVREPAGSNPRPMRVIVVPTEATPPPAEENKWVKTRGRLRSVGRQVVTWYSESAGRPSLQAMTIDEIQRELGLIEDETLDGWGTPIRFDAEGNRFQLLSAGPDGVFGNSDDIDYRRSLARPDDER